MKNILKELHKFVKGTYSTNRNSKVKVAKLLLVSKNAPRVLSIVRKGAPRATINRQSGLPARKSALRHVYFQSPLIKSPLPSQVNRGGRNNYATGLAIRLVRISFPFTAFTVRIGWNEFPASLSLWHNRMFISR